MIVTLSADETRMLWLVTNGDNVASSDIDLHVELRKMLRPCVPADGKAEYLPFGKSDVRGPLITYIGKIVDGVKQVRGDLVEDMMGLRDRVKSLVQAAAADPPK